MIVFDEVKYAENIIKYGCNKKYILVDFKVLAKYFLQHKHYSEELTLEKMLILLREKQSIIPINYLPSKIQASIKYAKSELLRVAEPVAITYTELQKINNLPEHLRELAFVYLVLMLWNKEDNGFFIDKSDLKKLLRQNNLTNSKLNIMDGELEKLQYISFIDFCRKEKIKVDIDTKDNNIAFYVEDFDNMVLYYRRHNGKRIINCSDCGSLVEVRSNRQKYCRKCAKIHKNEQNRLSRKKLEKAKQ